jgi:hypothetical protein
MLHPIKICAFASVAASFSASAGVAAAPALPAGNAAIPTIALLPSAPTGPVAPTFAHLPVSASVIEPVSPLGLGISPPPPRGSDVVYSNGFEETVDGESPAQWSHARLERTPSGRTVLRAKGGFPTLQIRGLEPGGAVVVRATLCAAGNGGSPAGTWGIRLGGDDVTGDLVRADLGRAARMADSAAAALSDDAPLAVAPGFEAVGRGKLGFAPSPDTTYRVTAGFIVADESGEATLQFAGEGDETSWWGLDEVVITARDDSGGGAAASSLGRLFPGASVDGGHNGPVSTASLRADLPYIPSGGGGGEPGSPGTPSVPSQVVPAPAGLGVVVVGMVALCRRRRSTIGA